jgi:HicA toxin of bacterial toxin-antitoxin,
MNKKQRRTLESIFALPTKTNLRWIDIETLFEAVGCDTIEGSGSAVRFVKDGFVGWFHRPHPQKEAKPYQVRDARKFLSEIGISP